VLRAVKAIKRRNLDFISGGNVDLIYIHPFCKVFEDIEFIPSNPDALMQL
jgi:hypothetical protein